jgi:hypothetical protein
MHFPTDRAAPVPPAGRTIDGGSAARALDKLVAVTNETV